MMLTMNAVGIAAQPVGRESNQAFERGVRLQQKGDLAAAAQAYKSALKLTPRRIDALSNLGLVYAGLGEYGRAVQSFENALKIVPAQPTVLFNLGITYLEAAQDENARRTLTQLVEKQKSNYAARHYLGVSLLKLGRIEDGIAELETVASVHPEDLDTAYTLGSAYIKDRQLEKARQLIDRVISRHDTAEAHLIAGSYWMTAQDYRQAVLELRRAQQLNPSLPELGSNLGGAYAMTGSRDMAIQLFEAYLVRNPSDFDTLAFLGWLYLESDRVDDAAKMLNRAHAIRPDDTEVEFQMARLARVKGQFQEAAKLLERVVAAAPNHVRAHVLLAETYFRLKRTTEGRKEQQIVRRLNADEETRRGKDAGTQMQQ